MSNGAQSPDRAPPEAPRYGPNDPCFCGKGRKFKKCCLPRLRDLVHKATERKKFQIRPPPQAIFEGKRFRAVYNRILVHDQTETFHEFIVELLKATFGKRWQKEQLALPSEQQHVVMRWLVAWTEGVLRSRAPNHVPGQRFSGPASGDALVLLALADDLFRLQAEHRLPSPWRKRLQNRAEFQGVRYELAVAATFVRAGFKIEWNRDKDKSRKACEFVAHHPATGDSLAVEVKSRRRPGVLHQPGPRPDPATFKADVGPLFQEALAQNPGDRPFAIFIDLNLSPEPHGPYGLPPWVGDIERLLEPYRGINSPPAPFALVGFTNFAWHYLGQAVARRSQQPICFIPRRSHHPLKRADTIEALGAAFARYGDPPDDE